MFPFGASDTPFSPDSLSFPAKGITCGIAAIPSDCIILSNWVFGNSILAYEPFAKFLRIFVICVSVNNNLSQKELHH